MNRSLSPIAFVAIAVISLALPACKSKDNTLAPPPPGPAWVTVQRSTQSNLLDNRINTLSVGVDGTIWIATDSGATTFSGGNWGFVKDSLRYTSFGSGGGTSYSYKLNSIAHGMDGSIWFGLAGGGVKRYHPGSAFYVWRSYNVPDIAFGTISAVSADALLYGDVWVATPVAGISRYVPSLTLPDQGDWHTYTSTTTPQILTNQVKTTAHNDLNNSVWFGTYLGAISYNESDGWGNVVLPVDQGGVIVSIGFDNQNNVWFGKNAGASLGVTKYNRTSGDFTSYTHDNTGGVLPDGGVNVLTTDFRKIRWFGTSGGLARLDDTTWTAFNTGNRPELPSDTVTALTYDRKGNLWIGTANGIAVYNPDGTRF